MRTNHLWAFLVLELFEESGAKDSGWKSKEANPQKTYNGPENLPKGVIGKTSPYPTVVSVITLHHIDAGILENLSG